MIKIAVRWAVPKKAVADNGIRPTAVEKNNEKFRF
jgi:hypothetical protein